MIIEASRAYLEEHRRYHGILHPAYMLKKARDFGFSLSNSLIFAIWYHDSVLVPGNSDNEEESAKLFEEDYKRSGCVYCQETVDEVKQAILDTKFHYATSDNHVSKDLIDLDLAVLGEEWHTYESYVSGVKAEYSQLENFTEDLWKVGRSKFLKSMLDRDFIFYNAPDKIRHRAKMNLTKESNQLLLMSVEEST